MSHQVQMLTAVSCRLIIQMIVGADNTQTCLFWNHLDGYGTKR